MTSKTGEHLSEAMTQRVQHQIRCIGHMLVDVSVQIFRPGCSLPRLWARLDQFSNHAGQSYAGDALQGGAAVLATF